MPARPFLYFLLLLLPHLLAAQTQSVEALRKELEAATTEREKMNLHLDLAEALFRTNSRSHYDQAIRHAKMANQLAVDLRHPGISAQASFLLGRIYERKRDYRNAEVWYKSALTFAKQARDADLIIKTVEARSKLAVKDRNYRRAYQINQEAFNYFSSRGNSISEMDRENERVLARYERERKELERQLEALRRERDRLSADKTQLAQRSQQLEQQVEQVEEAITEKEQQIEEVARQKQKAEYVARLRKKQIDALQLARELDSLTLVQTQMQLENTRLANERTRYLFLLLAALAFIVLILAATFFFRMRAKQRTARQLAEKNRLIEEERKRSDELLLNILPAPIATELKEKGKATARRYEQVTILFADFRNFTKVAEQLSPEQLVAEIDYIFKGFDYIIGQYDDIEKIKTIGDAYMCASGLDERKRFPLNIVKAALEMQEFLAELAEQRRAKGLPWFEARIGLHTGPVVAGVVGVRKFAYDIWGDTVNIAARMESASEPGKVNISETTYRLVKYSFECTYRGKVEVKNKGQLDMYYVIGEKKKEPAGTALA